MNIGADFHDTISYNPDFFRNLFSSWKSGKIYIVTGTPEKNRLEIEKELEIMGLCDLYDEIIYGFEYSKENMDHNHFLRMREHKLNAVKDKKI